MIRALCAGDRFITADAFAAEAQARLGPDLEVVRHTSGWPDEPFGDVGGVREAAGDVDEVARLCRDVDVVLTHLAPIGAAALEGAERLRVIGSVRGGPVNVDLAAATARGVPVVYLPGRNLGAVAEFTLGAMIALTRRFAPASRSLAGGVWDPRWFRLELTGPELSACTVGLIGFGAVGERVAQLLAAFGSRVIVHDPYADPDRLAERGVEPVDLPTLLAHSDVVSVHARLSEETRHLLDDDAFTAMREGAYLVNTARGELVDRAALLRALESGRLAGAALDVHDPEPPDPADPLLGRDDVLLTPHLAGASRQVAELSVRRVVDDVATYLRTGELAHCANPDWRTR